MDVFCGQSWFGCLSWPLGVTWLIANVLGAIGMLWIARTRGRWATVVVIAVGVMAAALLGFDIGAMFPRHGDPKYIVYVGWIASGVLGMRLGIAAFGVLAFVFRRSLRRRAFEFLSCELLAFAAATAPVELSQWPSIAMAYVYWIAPFGSLPRVFLI